MKLRAIFSLKFSSTSVQLFHDTYIIRRASDHFSESWLCRKSHIGRQDFVLHSLSTQAALFKKLACNCSAVKIIKFIVNTFVQETMIFMHVTALGRALKLVARIGAKQAMHQ